MTSSASIGEDASGCTCTVGCCALLTVCPSVTLAPGGGRVCLLHGHDAYSASQGRAQSWAPWTVKEPTALSTPGSMLLCGLQCSLVQRTLLMPCCCRLALDTGHSTAGEAGRALHSHPADSLVGETEKKEIKYTQCQAGMWTTEKNFVKEDV